MSALSVGIHNIMSVKLDITAVVPELLDEIIFMDDSPALEAFENELSEIIAGMAEKSEFKALLEGVSPDEIIEAYRNAVINLQRSYLLWSEYEAKEPGGKRWGLDASDRINYCKLFYKAFGIVLISLNGKKNSVELSAVGELKAKFIAMIIKGGDLYNKLKDFFRGYIYGWLFNYLTEQKLMPEYAEFIVSLAVMSDKIKAAPEVKGEIIKKLKSMLSKGRFKYINGYVPVDLISGIIADRYDFSKLNGEDAETALALIERQIRDNYECSEDDDTVIYNVTANFMTTVGSAYSDCGKFAAEEFENAFGGVRTFLDGSRGDTGNMSVSDVRSAAELCCGEMEDEFYSSAHASAPETGLKAENKGYLYPAVYKDGSEYYFAPCARYALFARCDKALFTPVDQSDLPIRSFLFMKDEMKFNYFYYSIRELLADGGQIKAGSGRGFSVRSDKMGLIEELKQIDEQLKDSTEEDRRMNKIGKALELLSGNNSAARYEEVAAECFYGSKLFESYIKFRTHQLTDDAAEAGVETQKKLIAQLNGITL